MRLALQHWFSEGGKMMSIPEDADGASFAFSHGNQGHQHTAVPIKFPENNVFKSLSSQLGWQSRTSKMLAEQPCWIQAQEDDAPPSLFLQKVSVGPSLVMTDGEDQKKKMPGKHLPIHGIPLVNKRISVTLQLIPTDDNCLQINQPDSSSLLLTSSSSIKGFFLVLPSLSINIVNNGFSCTAVKYHISHEQ
jgi:hypothetical protein